MPTKYVKVVGISQIIYITGLDQIVEVVLPNATDNQVFVTITGKIQKNLYPYHYGDDFLNEFSLVDYVVTVNRRNIIEIGDVV